MAVDRVKLGREISMQIENDPEVQRKAKAFAEEVAAYWRDVAWPESATRGRHGGVHPYDTGEYRASIHVVQNRDTRGRFAAGFTVISDSPNANFIEYGTGVDKPGSRSPWGPNTPTPEFAPAAITAHHFGGTAD